ncbi:MAG: radical SAM protein [Deltaproteobacteria bacterium]|nr:radical SAM protein [Deltaproteobacteria bacterium]MBW2122967.1 radical SAM protein [Deltaproteobacteria bacterium]
MPSFICDFLKEIVVLSDGGVTTCCMDPLGMNRFGSIYRDSFEDIQARYMSVRRRITKDVLLMPRCSRCFNKIKEQGFPETGTYKVDPDSAEIRRFIDRGRDDVFQLVIELSSKCNLKCNGCMQSRVNFEEYRADPFLDVDYLQSWVGRYWGEVKKIRLYNYGETFMHPGALGFCSFVKKHGPDTVVEIATNGMLLDTHEKRREIVLSGVDDIVFSIHGSSQEIIQKYMTRKFSFEKVLDTLKDLAAIKHELGFSKPRLFWKYLLFEWNDSDEEITRARTLSREIGLEGVIFGLVGFPAPSRRFTRHSEEWKRLVRESQAL